MKQTRTRMLIVFTAAAIVVSFFIHWEDMEKGFWEGYREGVGHSAKP